MAEYRGPRWSALHLRDCVPALRTRCAGCLCLPMPSAPPVPGWDPQEEGPHACTEDTGSTMPRGVWLRGRVEGRVSSVPPSGGTVRLQPPTAGLWVLPSALRERQSILSHAGGPRLLSNRQGVGSLGPCVSLGQGREWA